PVVSDPATTDAYPLSLHDALPIYFEPDGIAGDLGGGSLELIDIRGRTYDRGVTTPLGGLRLVEISGNSLSKAATHARKILRDVEDRKSTRLNSSHVKISYAVFCLK